MRAQNIAEAIAFVAGLLMLGLVGGMECGSIGIRTGIIDAALCLLVIGICLFIINHNKRRKP